MHIKLSALSCYLLLPALLLLAFFCSCSVSAANPPSYGCMSDELMKMNGPLPSVVTQELHATIKNVQKAFTFALSNEWEPLRITVSANDLFDTEKHCAAESVGAGKNVKRNNMKGEQIKCLLYDVLKPEAVTVLTGEILPRAIKLHTDRLLVQRSQVPWKMPSFAKEGVCTHFTVPESHRNPGLSDADMVLYVAAGPFRATSKEKSVAWAVPCAQLNGRPVAGAMNFAADKIILSRHTVRITAHELAHALGFTVAHMTEKSMLESIEVRSKTTVSVVKSTETKAKTQQHYNCTSAKGMELQMGDDNQPESHWSRRNAKDELMAPLLGSEDAFLGLYTALTLAAFADLGYYKAKFDLAEPMSWGHGAQCKFLDEQCVKSGASQFPALFCSKLNFSQQACSSDRIGVGRCSLLTSILSIPEQFRYFENPAHGGDPDLLTDYCPIIGRQSGLFCTNTESGYSSMITGSVRGQNSWCLDGDALVAKKRNRDESVDGVCAEVRCVGNAVHVKYSDNDAFHPCPEGQTLSVQSSAFVSGSIKCPKYSEVCTVASDGSSLVEAPVAREPRSTQEPAAAKVNVEGPTAAEDSLVPFKHAESTTKAGKGATGHEGHFDGTAGPHSSLFSPFLLALAVAFCVAALQVC